MLFYMFNARDIKAFNLFYQFQKLKCFIVLIQIWTSLIQPFILGSNLGPDYYEQPNKPIEPTTSGRFLKQGSAKQADKLGSAKSLSLKLLPT